jgi:hypothetical protein
MQSSPPPHEYSDAVSQGESFKRNSQDNDVDVCLPVDSSTATLSDHVILSSTPKPADYDDDVKKMPAVTQSATTTSSSAGTESRYPKRKRIIIKSMTEDWESDFDDDEDDLNDDDDDDDEVCLVSATTTAGGADNVGIASSTTTLTKYDDGMPVDYPISSPPPAPANRQCKAESCTKHSQGPRTDGFCARHHTEYLMNTGQIAFWTCDTCGNRMRMSYRKCNNCQGEISPTTTITPKPANQKGKKKKSSFSSSPGSSSRVVEKKEEEDEEEEEVTFLHSTTPPVAERRRRRRSKDSKPMVNNSRSTTSRVVVAEDYGRYPKRGGTRNNSTDDDDETPLSRLQQQQQQRQPPKKELPPSTPTKLPSSPGGHFRHPRNNMLTPNSTGSSNRSSRGIDTALDYLLDFDVESSSSYFSPTNKATCRANSCNKFSQNRCNGFCKRHYNLYLIQTEDEQRASSTWTCEDSELNECHDSKRPYAKKTNRTTPAAAAAVATSSWASSSNSRSSSGGGGGIRMPHTYVPPECVHQISQQPRRNKANGRTYCKFSTCEKFGRPTTMDGFCFTHYHMFSLENKNTMAAAVAAAAAAVVVVPPVSFENVPEVTLLERTRNNLLNGRDGWICIDCAIEVPSITYPCGQCSKMISFVPLMMYEFEEFVKKQREINMTRRQRNAIGGA